MPRGKDAEGGGPRGLAPLFVYAPACQLQNIIRIFAAGINNYLLL